MSEEKKNPNSSQSQNIVTINELQRKETPTFDVTSDYKDNMSVLSGGATSEQLH